MSIANHTTSLELSIALKKAGWPQEESLFYWSAWSDHSPIEHTDCHELHWELTDANGGSIAPRVSSPLASELMERMPPYLIHDYQAYALTIKRIETDGHCVMYEAIVADKVAFYLEGIGHDEILPNAIAKLALHLIQEGIIKF